MNLTIMDLSVLRYLLMSEKNVEGLTPEAKKHLQSLIYKMEDEIKRLTEKLD